MQHKYRLIHIVSFMLLLSFNFILFKDYTEVVLQRQWEKISCIIFTEYAL